MPDINEWRLSYGTTVLDFGLLSTDYPLATQVEIGDADRTEQDSAHPTSDGMIFGKDRLSGFDLTFDLTTVPDFPMPASPWNDALDLFGAFKAAWRADSIRGVPGAYATLLNKERNRQVYGRPRKIAPKNNRLRKGVIGYVATFETNDPNFYSGTEKAALITPVPPVSGGFSTPLLPPFSTAVGAAELADTVNNGNLNTWPVISFHGPGKAFSLELLNATNKVLWKIAVPDQIKYDQVLVVDTRPWRRSATLNGLPANGRIRGTQIEKCTIPVGSFKFRFKVTDQTGTAFADIKWRDAYASL